MLDDKKKEMIFNKINLAFFTTPFLLGLIILESVFEGLQEMGEFSEEVFRGDRLRILNLTELEPQKEKS